MSIQSSGLLHPRECSIVEVTCSRVALHIYIYTREKVWLEYSLSQSEGGGMGGGRLRVENQALGGIFRCREITQKKEYNIQNTAKVLNQEY